jgi:hypothetical protein
MQPSRIEPQPSRPVPRSGDPASPPRPAALGTSRARGSLLCVALVTLAATAGCDESGVLPGQSRPAAVATTPAVQAPALGALERQAGNVDESATPIAWSSVTVEDTARLAEARRLGTDRRRSSVPLRAAEEQACSGLAEPDRDESPFAHHTEIVRVDPIEHGVRVHFRHVDGLTADWLEHLVECHLARDEVIGPDGPDTKECPLAVRGASAHVAVDGAGYLVEVRSNDIDASAEIVRRAAALKH